MRLTAGQIRRLQPRAAVDIYLLLEEESRGRKEIMISPKKIKIGKNWRVQSFRALRQHGFDIRWSRKDQAYRVTFPDPPFDAAALTEEVNQYDKKYQVTAAIITALRNNHPDMPPDDFAAALRTALMAAQSSQIEPRHLPSWLNTGISRERNNNNKNPKSKTNPNSKKDNDEWMEKIQKQMQAQEDTKQQMKRLYGRTQQ